MLIVLRGNSGSGKSTVAKMLREALLEKEPGSKIAVVEQDYLRRIVLKEKESEGVNNIDLIYATVSFALDRGYIVILEGILYSHRYIKMIEKIKAINSNSYFFYLDIPLEETFKRHKSKSNSKDFGETEMRNWYKEKDILGFADEIIIKKELNCDEIVNKIIATVNL